MTLKDTNSIILSCKNGSRESFSELCEEYYDYIFRVAFRILANTEDAKDVTQETFIKVWKHLKSYNPKIKFTTWLYRIVTNHCIDELRKQRNHTNIKCEEALQKIDKSAASERFDHSDLASIILCVAKELSPKQRAIFTLRDLEGLEMNEISEIMEMPSDAVKSNLYHARKAIRNILITKYAVEY